MTTDPFGLKEKPRTYTDVEAYEKLRAFAEHVPRNAAMVMVTGWHVIAAELLRRTLAACEQAAEVITELEYDGASSLTPAQAELRARLAGVRGIVKSAAAATQEKAGCSSSSSASPVLSSEKQPRS